MTFARLASSLLANMSMGTGPNCSDIDWSGGKATFTPFDRDPDQACRDDVNFAELGKDCFVDQACMEQITAGKFTCDTTKAEIFCAVPADAYESLSGQACDNGAAQDSACYREGLTVCNDTGIRCDVETIDEVKSAEICDGIDNDCDGTADNNLALDPSCTTPSPDGNCLFSGTPACIAGALECLDAAPLDEEICDGADNDCDGETDEDLSGIGAACDLAVGACSFSGTLVCNPNVLSGELSCESPDAYEPHAEACDGIDNDCDGLTDEADNAIESNTLTQVIENDFGGLGECNDGLEQCAGVNDAGEPIWGVTVIPGEPSVETCDGLDNDCNGLTDVHPSAADPLQPGDPLTQACTAPDGFCQGFQICIGGSFAELCELTPVDDVEVCDLIDNDCDGKVDAADDDFMGGLNTDGIFVSPGENCDNGELGVCTQLGAYHCPLGASTMICSAPSGAQNASLEVCNNIDDDCDGDVDENATDVGEFCSDGFSACEETGVTVCTQGVEICGVTADITQATPEVCDNVDNDCDGLTDSADPDIDCTPSCEFDLAAYAAAGIEITIDADGSGHIHKIVGESTTLFLNVTNAEFVTVDGVSTPFLQQTGTFTQVINLEENELIHSTAFGFEATTECPNLSVTVEPNFPPSVTILSPLGKGHHPEGAACSGVDHYSAEWMASDPNGQAITCDGTVIDTAGVGIFGSITNIEENNGVFTATIPSTVIPEWSVNLLLHIACSDALGMSGEHTVNWGTARKGTLVALMLGQGHAEDATAQNAAVTVVGSPNFDEFKGGFEFNGTDDEIQIAANALPTVLDNLEILVNIRPDHDTIGTIPHVLERAGTDTNNRFGMFLQSGFLRGWACPESGTCSSDQLVGSLEALSETQMTQARFTYDGTTSALFVDDELQASNTLFTGNVVTDGALRIGQSTHYGPTVSPYKGVIGNVIISDLDEVPVCP